MKEINPYPPKISNLDEKKPKPNPIMIRIDLNPKDWNESMVALIEESIRWCKYPVAMGSMIPDTMQIRKITTRPVYPLTAYKYKSPAVKTKTTPDINAL